MRIVLQLAAAAALGAAALSCGGAGEPQGERPLALTVAAEVESIARERVLWPGFDPRSIPLAIYTGEHTYLFRHPAPPPEYSPLPGAESDAMIRAGRDEAVTSNTSAEIGGTMTATLLADGPRAGAGATELAATAVHEAFHVFQRERHPGWSGNEGDLFLYPADDARLLGLRRLESAALARALASADHAEAACWTGVALRSREERFAGMDPAFGAYERLTELNEGLASYVQLLAAGRTTVKIPELEFGATEVRDRTYAVGPALAFLLDRFRPGWQAQLETRDDQFLDELLRSSLAEGGVAVTRCELPATERTRLLGAAMADAAAVVAARTERRQQFDARSGWRVIVTAPPSRPLWPQGFDPLNVQVVDGGVLHTRFLRLGNEAAELQALDEAGADLESLTVGAGAHPLFNGIAVVTVAGLQEPEIVTEGTRVILRAPGLSARFDSARVEVDGARVKVVVQ